MRAGGLDRKHGGFPGFNREEWQPEEKRFPLDNTVYIGDNLEALHRMKSGPVNTVYFDPSFFT